MSHFDVGCRISALIENAAHLAAALGEAVALGHARASPGQGPTQEETFGSAAAPGSASTRQLLFIGTRHANERETRGEAGSHARPDRSQILEGPLSFSGLVGTLPGRFTGLLILDFDLWSKYLWENANMSAPRSC